MPSSPVKKRVQVSNAKYDIYNGFENWKQFQKIIIPDQATDHYYSIWFDNTEDYDAGDGWVGVDARYGDASLMCCQMDDNPATEDNWYHVEDLDKDHTNILDTIKAVFGISFHESVWKEISPAQTLKDNPIV